LAALGAAALANHLLARRSERRHPPKGRFISVDGVSLHYLDKGTGSPIVLIHGNGVTAEDFVLSGLFESLAATHRVIAFDRPGFGYSERPRRREWSAAAQSELIFAALGQMGAHRPLVVGHSWGALVALNIGLAHGEDLAGVVLMSGYYSPTPRADVALAASPALPVAGDVLRYTISPLVGRLIAPLVFKALFHPAEVPERFTSGFSTAMALRPSQLRASAADSARMIPDAASAAGKLSNMHVPVLIIAGTKDKIVDFEQQSAWLAERIPSARLLPIEGAGHMVHYVAGDALVSAIGDFLRPSERQRPGGAEIGEPQMADAEAGQ
jgi:pimeloyl-ACP methyl ester carboxylesterase